MFSLLLLSAFSSVEGKSLQNSQPSPSSVNIDTFHENKICSKTKSLIPPKSDPSGFFVPTLNQTGYMTTHLDPYSQAFISNSRRMKTA